MMRLPWFRYRAPATLSEVARILAGEGADAMPIAGGTDLLPNMKRRHQTPGTLVSLGKLGELRKVANGSGLRIGATVTLSEVTEIPAVKNEYRGLYQAAMQVATTHLRNMGTLGGNLCLDTRCTYYNQNYEWRKAIDFCMKAEGEICWVATASKRCLAVSSTDTAPALISLGARVKFFSTAGEREVALADLYNNDGIDYLKRKPGEILTEVVLPRREGWKSTYWKLRRRGSFDFPVLGVAAAVKMAKDGTIEDARLVLGAVSSHPLVIDVKSVLVGQKAADEIMEKAASLAESRAKPMDNTDLDLRWRKHVVGDFVGYALRELRGDDMRAVRLRTARQAL